ncbi:MAG: phosphoglucosamine mutase [Desulfatiglandaceae bacterium]
MSNLFGTDGIRGIANAYPITPEVGVRLGRAVVRRCRRKGTPCSAVIGRDTRASGQMLALAVASGVLSAGGNAYMVGQVPTPGVAYLTRSFRAGMGIVISASHNPHEYNGFKLFSSKGFKLSEDEETGIEERIHASEAPHSETHPGRAEFPKETWRQCVGYLERSFPDHLTLKGTKLVLDCANGAAFQVAPALFERLGATAVILSSVPDGININDHCGSQYPEAVREEVLKTGAQAGLAFDGDGDRLVAVDEKGSIFTGDQILAICAGMLKGQDALQNNLVVSTIMSNMGLGFALREMGIQLATTGVGDRHVMEAMKERKAIVGGEESGHIIFLNHHTTGDGILSALQLLSAMQWFDKPLSELGRMMTVFPQALLNVPVREKREFAAVPGLPEVIRHVEEALGSRGRVVVRYSGTEPLCRVMVEGENKDDVERYAEEIAGVIGQALSYSNSSDSSAG